jgi:hypothetical protein
MSTSADPKRTVLLAHKGSLAVLAVCAALTVIYSMALPDEPGESRQSRTPAPVFPYTAVTLGVGAIACRQQALSNARRGRATPGLSIACFALAAGIGIVGMTLFWIEGLVQPALLYTMGGAILALRSPPPMPAGDDTRERS